MTSAGQSGGDGDYPLKISEIETSLAQLKGAIQGETEYREVYANEISEIETSLAQLKGAIQGETEYREVHANEISEIETRLYVIQTSRVRSRLAALKDFYEDLEAVLLLRTHGSELFTDLDVTDYEALIKNQRLKGKFPFSKGWCLPPGERWD